MANRLQNPQEEMALQDPLVIQPRQNQHQPKTQRTKGQGKPNNKTSFNPDPEVIPLEDQKMDATVLKSSKNGESRPAGNSSGNGVTWQEMGEGEREVSRKKIKRIVALVGVGFIVLCVVLVAVSLSFGSKIDDLVQNVDAEDSNLPDASVYATNSSSSFADDDIFYD